MSKGSCITSITSPKTCEIHSLAHTRSMKSWFVFFSPYSQSSEGFPVYFAKPVKPQHPPSRWSKVYKERNWNVEGKKVREKFARREVWVLTSHFSQAVHSLPAAPLLPSVFDKTSQVALLHRLPLSLPHSPTLSLSLSTWTHMWLSQQLKTALWEHLVVSEATTAKSTTIDRTDDKVTQNISSQRQKHG